MYIILYLRSRTKEKAFEELYKKWKRRWLKGSYKKHFG
jgi:hypothetical protein